MSFISIFVSSHLNIAAFYIYINAVKFSEEIARQFENSQSKYVLTIGLFFDNIKEAAAQYGKIEKIITLGMEETPEDCLSFIGMLITDDGSLYQKDYTCDPHNDIVVMPYSSGTTGPPKGVELTHYNMVANM